MLSGLIGKLHGIYAVDKFKVYWCTIPPPSPLARPPAPSQGDLAVRYRVRYRVRLANTIPDKYKLLAPQRTKGRHTD